MSQANIPFFRAAKNGLSVDGVSQRKLEVEKGCAIITLHMSFFTSEQLPVVSLLSLITVTSKKSPPASSVTDSSVRVGERPGCRRAFYQRVNTFAVSILKLVFVFFFSFIVVSFIELFFAEAKLALA